MFSKLTPVQVKHIKAQIWVGRFYQDIAEAYGVGEATIAAVAMGIRWRDVPWPDGTTGRLSTERRAFITRLRDRAMRRAAKAAR